MAYGEQWMFPKASVTPGKGTTPAPYRYTSPYGPFLSELKNAKPYKPVVKKPSPKKPPKTSRPSGSGSVYRGPVGGGRSSTPTAKTTPDQTFSPLGGDIYKPYQNRLDALYAQYNALRPEYTPGTFQYADWGGRDQFSSDAQRRIDSDIAANVATLSGQRVATNSAYEQALRNSNQQTTADVNALNQQGAVDTGRMANMAANAGITSGFGALANDYGISNDYASRIAAARLAGSNANQDINMSRGNSMAEIAGQEAAMRLGRESRIGELTDQMSDSDFQKYSSLRAQGFNEFQAKEEMARMADQDRLTSAYSNLAGNENLINAQMGMAQDNRNYLYNDYWANRNFNYTAAQDKLGYNKSVSDTNLAANQFNTSMSVDQKNNLLSAYTSLLVSGAPGSLDAAAKFKTMLASYGINV